MTAKQNVLDELVDRLRVNFIVHHMLAMYTLLKEKTPLVGGALETVETLAGRGAVTARPFVEPLLETAVGKLNATWTWCSELQAKKLAVDVFLRLEVAITDFCLDTLDWGDRVAKVILNKASEWTNTLLDVSNRLAEWLFGAYTEVERPESSVRERFVFLARRLLSGVCYELQHYFIEPLLHFANKFILVESLCERASWVLVRVNEGVQYVKDVVDTQRCSTDASLTTTHKKGSRREKKD